MSQSEEYTPPAIWVWDKENGGQFASINRPVSGATHDKDLPVGEHPLQLYSLGTPNGVKATVMLEELLAAGHDAEYDAWIVNIGQGDQFSSGFVSVNPNSKIPALLDRSTSPSTRVFESGSILFYLAEKYDFLLAKSGPERTEAMNWLMWQMGSAPFIGGGFGHFYHYAPVKIQYAIDRYSMETKRLFDVADKRLGEARFLAGDNYSIADIAAWTWLAALHRGLAYGEAKTFLQLHEFENVGRWVEEIGARPAVKRGQIVNRVLGNTPLPERHSAADIDNALAAKVSG
ncbi:MAG: glutathione-dependent disulfide-bond oxidoreductase [Blastomonas sp.]